MKIKQIIKVKVFLWKKVVTEEKLVVYLTIRNVWKTVNKKGRTTKYKTRKLFES